MRILPVFGISLSASLVAAACCGGGTPTQAAVFSLQHAKKFSKSDREYIRYLWHPGPKNLTEEFDSVIRLMANSLSREGELQAPEQIAPDLWQIDLRNYAWDYDTWEKFASIDSYFHFKVTTSLNKRVRNKIVRTTKGKSVIVPEAADLATYLNTTTPIVRADWWLVQVSRQLSLRNKQTGVGYYDWLGLNNKQDYLNLMKVRLNDTRSLKLDRMLAVSRSNVAEQNRQIEVNPTYAGRLWLTLDTEDGQGKGNAIRNLRRGDFKHQAEEGYMPLPNGLPVVWLGDANGVRQNSAPEFIGPDKSILNTGNDGRIHIFLACYRCHAGEVLQPVEDWTRKNYTVGRLALQVPADYPGLEKDEQFRLYQELKRQWLAPVNDKLAVDRLGYQLKILEATGQTAAEISKRLAKAFHYYADTLVGPDQAARELGCTTQELRQAFIRFAVAKGAIDPELGGLLGTMQITGGIVTILIDSKPEPILRLHWEELYPLARKYMALDLAD